MVVNTYATFFMRPKGRIPTVAWGLANSVSAILLYSGYVNPEIMMRPRNTDAVFVPSSEVLKYLKRNETVIVTKGLEDGKVIAFPDTQVLRPHVVRLPGRKADGSQRTMTYCGLTNLGMVFDIAKHSDGKDVELAPMTQLENNLVLMDKVTGHLGQQINGVDEVALLKKMGGEDFQLTKRGPSQDELKTLKMKPSEMGIEVATWRMSLWDFIRTYPENGEVLNDYKMFKDIKKPIKTMYNTIMDTIFETSIHFQATNPAPVFPTLKNIDKRLPSKELVWSFNVGDDYAALTVTFVRNSKNGTKNLEVGGESIVASWDPNSSSLGIFKNPTGKAIQGPVNIHGHVVVEDNSKEGDVIQLERLNTVKSGAFWCVISTFFPDVRVNPDV